MGGTKTIIVTVGALAAILAGASVVTRAGDAPRSSPGELRGIRPPTRLGDRRAMLTVFDRSYEAWAAELRACTPSDLARAKSQLPETPAALAERERVVSILGRLLPGMPEINPVGCDDNVPCCNGGPFEWFVVLSHDCPTRWSLKVRPRGAPHALSGSGMDCAVRGYDAEADWVIVSGTVGRGEIVVDAEVCRVPADLLRASQRLTDADYARLTGPASRHKRGVGSPRCPPSRPARSSPRRRPEPAPPRSGQL